MSFGQVVVTWFRVTDNAWVDFPSSKVDAAGYIATAVVTPTLSKTQGFSWRFVVMTRRNVAVTTTTTTPPPPPALSTPSLLEDWKFVGGVSGGGVFVVGVIYCLFCRRKRRNKAGKNQRMDASMEQQSPGLVKLFAMAGAPQPPHRLLPITRRSL